MTTTSKGWTTPITNSPARRSIAVVGEDPLMVRTLDRLLRTAGYSVGTGSQLFDAGGVRGSRNFLDDVALTIIDVPDDWSRSHELGARPEGPRNVEAGRILWISAMPSPGDEPEGYLVKPFTSTQLLDKVRTLLCRQ